MKKNLPLLTIVIPCLNEKETIKECVLEASKYAKKNFSKSVEIIVSDNGSTDGTLKILNSLRSVKTVQAPLRGYGAALHWGILSSKSDYVLFADADLSYPFSNIKYFKKLLPQAPDLVLGSRFKGKIEKDAMPFLHRYIGTPVLTFLIKLVYKIQVTDCNSGMRLVNKNFYKSLNMRNSGMEWASELLIKTALKKGKYFEVPILFKKDKRKSKPHLLSWSDGWRHLKAILLLKPSSLYFPLMFFLLMALLLFYYSNELWGLFFASTATVLLFSTLAAHYLDDHLNGKNTRLSKLLGEFILIPFIGMMSILVFVLALILPSNLIILKIYLLNTMTIIYVWVFLIETIKTYLVKQLPNDLSNLNDQ